MSYREFLQETNLEGRVLAITRVLAGDRGAAQVPHCVYRAVAQVLAGASCLLTADSCGCGGFAANAGLAEGEPPIPGGFGAFLSQGAGEGYLPGARLKCSPEIASAQFDRLPKDVMDGKDALLLEPFREDLTPDLVTCFATPDQLSALLFLHGFCRSDYDSLLATTASGCASLFRIPLGQLKQAHPRAVLGNLDMAERFLLDKNLLAFTVAGADFSAMLAHTEDCFFHTPMWQPLRRRIHQG